MSELELSDAQIIEIRDRHLPNQGDSFDCIAFARDLLAARPEPSPEERAALNHASNQLRARRDRLLAQLEPHVDFLDADSLILWAVVRALAAEVVVEEPPPQLKSTPAAIDALAGLVGWAQMILRREDLPASIREDFADNHRLTTALLELSARGR